MLGLTNDPSGDNEISGGNSSCSTWMARSPIASAPSTSQWIRPRLGEQWTVYGSDNGSPFSLTKIISGTDEGVHSLGNTIYDNYIFAYTGAGRGRLCRERQCAARIIRRHGGRGPGAIDVGDDGRGVCAARRIGVA